VRADGRRGTTVYVCEWLTLAQAAHALGVKRAELRPLHETGDILVEMIRPNVWRVSNRSVQDLLSTPEWKGAGGED
jgi:hypothetical protein